MGTMSKRKGKRGERDAAKELSQLFGVECRRGVQYQGGPGSPDVVGIPSIHVEVKRTEKLSLYSALQQSIDEAAEGEVPVVLHRPNGKEWVVIHRLSDWPELAAKIYLQMAGDK